MQERSNMYIITRKSSSPFPVIPEIYCKSQTQQMQMLTDINADHLRDVSVFLPQKISPLACIILFCNNNNLRVIVEEHLSIFPKIMHCGESASRLHRCRIIIRLFRMIKLKKAKASFLPYYRNYG